MPVMIIQGTADPLVPYQGGAVGRRRRARGHVVSTEQAVRLWSDHNGCAPAVVAKLPDTTDDGCWVERFTHTGGRDGSEVVLYKVHGGGHTLPGGIQYLPKRLVGPVCRDFNGVDAIADFFDRHHR